ncbi:MAG: CDP-alcohol phosphatidyltransferase family protein [Candidatus Aenigmarchaeota archaeon]|nr:CDP-alcohol phosphatidyltransferase family protein [Candidatus Aenigmarchaeota archaeon]
MFYANRSRFKKLSIKTGIFFARFHLSPNQWTFVTLIPVAVTMLCILYQSFLLAAVFLIITAFIDMIDGAVARILGEVSRLGAYLDTVMDRYVEFLIIAALIFAGLPDFYLPVTLWLFLYLFGAMMTTYAKAAAKEKDIVMNEELKGGLMERAERLIILFAGLLLAGLDSVMFLSYAIVILAVGSNFTAFQRMWKAVRKVRAF